MDVGKYDITINQGSTFELSMKLKDSKGRPKDLTGYIGQCQIRKSVNDTSVLASPQVIIDPNPASGILKLYLSHTETSLLTFNFAVYDIKLVTPLNKVIKILEGKVKLNFAVTRDDPEE